VVLRRRMPRARGTAYPINKRTSHITLILAPKEIEAKEVKTKAKVKSTTKK
jgi:ribosomal protein L22